MPVSRPTNSEPGQEGLSFANALRDCLVAGVIWLSPNRQSATLTGEAARLLGCAGEQGLHTSIASLPEALQSVARELFGSYKPLPERELELHSPGQGPLVLRVSGFPVQSGDKPAGGILVLHNLTPARQLQTHLAQLDRLADAGVLAASMAHEIKNALVAGKTFIDLLLEKNQEAELVEIVRRELGRIDAIVTRMLRFAGPGRGARGPVSLHEVLEHSLRLVEHRAECSHLVLKRSLQAAPDKVQGDDYELQQAFVNLLLNALDALGSNGTLTVATERLTPQAAAERVPQLPKGAYVCLAIQDTGVGVPAEHLERVFEPFFTTKASGTGLGLPITQRIIQDHQGAITVESQAGQGTTFRVFLPAL